MELEKASDPRMAQMDALIQSIGLWVGGSAGTKRADTEEQVFTPFGIIETVEFEVLN
jgi:hypothetical protein